jgi:hypothetical protein
VGHGVSGVPFISWLGHGAADLAPPGVFTGAKANMFAFDADVSAMQALADKLLNPAGAGTVAYKAIAPYGMVSFMDIASCSSGTDVVGWLPGRETAIWVILAEIHPADPAKDRIVFWAPYIFINYTIGMVIGRQTWGWPKVLADITVASDDPAAPVFGCTTTYFPTLSQTTQGVTGSLFKVVGFNPAERPLSMWGSGKAAFDAFAAALLSGLARGLIDDLGEFPQVPSVALKQFRQPGAAETACYQAICDSPIEITAFSDAGPQPDNLTLQITTCQSHQIVADFLGRAPDPNLTSLPIVFGAWANLDFQALTGADVVVNQG